MFIVVDAYPTRWETVIMQNVATFNTLEEALREYPNAVKVDGPVEADVGQYYFIIEVQLSGRLVG